MSMNWSLLIFFCSLIRVMGFVQILHSSRTLTRRLVRQANKIQESSEPLLYPHNFTYNGVNINETLTNIYNEFTKLSQQEMALQLELEKNSPSQKITSLASGTQNEDQITLDTASKQEEVTNIVSSFNSIKLLLSNGSWEDDQLRPLIDVYKSYLIHYEDSFRYSNPEPSFRLISNADERSVICNREVNMQHVKAIGFDMDYTLAEYSLDFLKLAHKSARDKLVHGLKYPMELLGVPWKSLLDDLNTKSEQARSLNETTLGIDQNKQEAALIPNEDLMDPKVDLAELGSQGPLSIFSRQGLVFRPDIVMRGCLIDKKRGNFLKLDQHRYVRVAQHGLTQISKWERKSVYRESFQETETFKGSDFSNIDTFFSLVDGCLFAQIVELKDKLDTLTFQRLLYKPNDPLHNERLDKLREKSYMDVWNDIRTCINQVHIDGSLKKPVELNPGKYINYDPELFPMLKEFRKQGVKVFLLTNSYWQYTHAVMNYLYSQAFGENKSLDWADAFDLVIVGGNKPGFLIDEWSLSLFKLHPSNGSIENIAHYPENINEAHLFIEKHGKFFQGGNANTLHSLLQLQSGDRLLYVGDHIYSDVLKSKRLMGWRTCLIVPELEDEIKVHRKHKRMRDELLALREKQYQLDNLMDVLTSQLDFLKRFVSQQESPGLIPSESSYKVKDNDSLRSLMLEVERQWDLVSQDLDALRNRIREKLERFNSKFNPRWGQVLKAGFQESRVSKQIQDYACLYTSKASNLGLISPLKPFRTRGDNMPHESILLRPHLSTQPTE